MRSAVSGLRQLLNGQTSRRGNAGGSTSAQRSSDDGSEATRQQLADLLQRRAATDMQVTKQVT
jgi:hypothetical protein